MIDPNQALQNMLFAGANPSPFAPNSRYYSAPILVYSPGPGSAVIRYVARRFIPSPDHYRLLQEKIVNEADRLDNLSAQFLGDPEAFWRICDANAVLRPDELTETPGRLIRITLPAELTYR
jgi:hypothetical protein